jgi:hypothetical protein
MTPGRLRVDSGVTATLMLCGSRSFWPRLMYHTSINSKSSKLSIAPTLDTHTRFLGQSLRGLRGLRGSFKVREKSKSKFSVTISFFHMQILELRVEFPAPRSFRSMVSSVATSAESPQRRRVTSAPPSHLSATATFFFPCKNLLVNKSWLFFFWWPSRSPVTTQISDRKKSNNRVIRTQQDVGRLLNS